MGCGPAAWARSLARVNAGDVRLLAELGLMALAGVMFGAGLGARRRRAPPTMTWGFFGLAGLAGAVAFLVLLSAPG